MPQGFLSHVAKAMDGFLGQHGEQFAQQLWLFLHSGLTVAAFDRLVFGGGAGEEGADSIQKAEQDEHVGPPPADESGTGPDW